MAKKIRPRKNWRRTVRGRGYRDMHAKVAVGRQDGSPTTARFFACFHFKTGGFDMRLPTHAKSRMEGPNCATGKNPREAVARALRQAAAKVKQRGGAFAGLQGLFTKPRNRTKWGR